MAWSAYGPRFHFCSYAPVSSHVLLTHILNYLGRVTNEARRDTITRRAIGIANPGGARRGPLRPIGSAIGAAARN